MKEALLLACRPVELYIEVRSRLGPLNVWRAQCSEEGANDLIMTDIHQVLGQRISLIGVVNGKVLPKERQGAHFGPGGLQILCEFEKLVHILKGDELPLDVQGKALLVDPAVEPGETVCLLLIGDSEVELQRGVILAKEDVLAGVVEVCFRNLVPLDHGDHIIMKMLVKVPPCLVKILAGKHFLDHSGV